MKSLEERILNKTIPIPECGCWIWTGSANNKGYGQIRRGRANEGFCFVHRAMWEIHNGPIPEGMCVCHTCDTPLCGNPHHLFLGTKKDNLADMTRKGRRAYGEKVSNKGEKAGFSKLTNEQVLAIRSDKRVSREIAKDYDIYFTTVLKIKRRENWKHI